MHDGGLEHFVHWLLRPLHQAIQPGEYLPHLGADRTLRSLDIDIASEHAGGDGTLDQPVLGRGDPVLGLHGRADCQGRSGII